MILGACFCAVTVCDLNVTLSVGNGHSVSPVPSWFQSKYTLYVK